MHDIATSNALAGRILVVGIGAVDLRLLELAVIFAVSSCSLLAGSCDGTRAPQARPCANKVSPQNLSNHEPET